VMLLPIIFDLYYFFSTTPDKRNFFYPLTNMEMKELYKNKSNKDLSVALIVN
jgi:hypothetical protein